MTDQDLKILKQLSQILSPLNFATKQLTKNFVNLQESENVISFMMSTLENYSAPKEFIETLKNRIIERRNVKVVSTLNFFSSDPKSHHFEYSTREEIDEFLGDFYEKFFKDDMTFNFDEVLNDTTEVKKAQSDSIEKQFQLFIEGRKGKRAKETIDFEKIMSIFEATGAVHAVAKIILDS